MKHQHPVTPIPNVCAAGLEESERDCNENNADCDACIAEIRKAEHQSHVESVAACFLAFRQNYLARNYQCISETAERSTKDLAAKTSGYTHGKRLIANGSMSVNMGTIQSGGTAI